MNIEDITPGLALYILENLQECIRFWVKERGGYSELYKELGYGNEKSAESGMNRRLSGGSNLGSITKVVKALDGRPILVQLSNQHNKSVELQDFQESE